MSRITRQEPLARTLIQLCPDAGRLLVSDVKEAFKQSDVDLGALIQRLETLESALRAVQHKADCVDRMLGEVGESIHKIGEEVRTAPPPAPPLSMADVVHRVITIIDLPSLTRPNDLLGARLSALEEQLARTEIERRALQGEVSLLKSAQRQTFELTQRDGRMNCFDTINHARNTLAIHASEACTLTFRDANGTAHQSLVTKGMQLINLPAGVYNLTTSVPHSECLQITIF